MIAYVAAGSNLGDPQEMFRKAIERLSSKRSISFRKLSPNYWTEPWGYQPQPKFLNAVWEIETDLSAHDLFKELVETEEFLGRSRTVKYGPRTIDLDLLAYGNHVVHEPDLEIPHPRLHERAFVLQPFADINPEWEHPVYHETVRTLLSRIV